MQPHGSRFEHEAAWPHLAACRTCARSISCATTDCKLFAANDAKRVAGQSAGTSRTWAIQTWKQQVFAGQDAAKAPCQSTRSASLQHDCGRFTAAQFLIFCTVARRSRGPSRSRREDVTCARAPAGVIRAQALHRRHRSSTVRRLKAGLGEDTSAQRVLTNARGKPWARARHSHHRWPPHAALARSRRGR